MSDHKEETGGADGDERAWHRDLHRNPNDSQVHAGGLTFSGERCSFPDAEYWLWSRYTHSPISRQVGIARVKNSLQASSRLSDP